MKRLTKSLVIFLVIATIIFVYASARGKIMHAQGGNTKNARQFVTIMPGDTVSQVLYPKHTNVKGITLAFNEAKDANFTADVEVRSANGDDLFHISSDQMDILGQVSLPLSNDVQGSEQKLELVISNIHYDNKKNVSIKAAEPLENTVMTINKEPIKNTAVVVTYTLSSIPYLKLFVLLLLAGCVTWCLSFAGSNLIREYALIATLFGLLFAIFTPIHQSSDEYVHYLKSQDVAAGHLITPKYNGDVGYFVSPKILDTVVAPVEKDEKFNPDVYHFISSQSVTPDDPSKQVFTKQPTTAVYTFIPYIPQAIGIKVAMLFHTSIWTANIFGRLANLFAFVLMSTYALKLMPIMKRTFMFFMLGPIIMFHASSLSADSVLMGSSFMFFALLMKLWFEKETMSRKDKILLGLSGFIMVICKFTYWPLVLLVLLAPSARFGSKKEFIRFSGIFIGITTLAVAAWNLFVMKYVGDAVAGGNVSASKQLLFMLHHPVEALHVFTVSLDHGLSEWIQMYNTFGFLSTPLKAILYIYPIIIVLLAVLDHQDRPLPLHKFQVWGLRVSVMAVTFLVMLSLYLTWTTVGNQYIFGIQGRYFIPIIPPLLLLIRQHFTLQVDKPSIPIFASRAATLFLAYSFLFWFAKMF